MLEAIADTPRRIADLKAKLAARENMGGYERNCEAIRAEIERLEGATQSAQALAEFLESNLPVASGDAPGEPT